MQSEGVDWLIIGSHLIRCTGLQALVALVLGLQKRCFQPFLDFDLDGLHPGLHE